MLRPCSLVHWISAHGGFSISAEEGLWAVVGLHQWIMPFFLIIVIQTEAAATKHMQTFPCYRNEIYLWVFESSLQGFMVARS